ncbi:MAG TPA: fasciclin domain-containing protein [Propionibacteriaceae bacterium]
MFTTNRVAKIATVAIAIAFPLSLAACGSDTAAPGGTTSTSAAAPSSSAPAMTPSASASASASASSMTEPFGTACSAVPKSGKGSFDGMSQDPVATAASNNPLLSTLVTAVKEAGLVDTLNNAENITVFAPTNDAFAKIDPATLKKVLADKKMLTAILTEHVVGETLTPETLAGDHDTLNKDQGVTVTGSGEAFTVNGNAKVLCGNVQTANATVYIIDTVLLPKS